MMPANTALGNKAKVAIITADMTSSETKTDRCVGHEKRVPERMRDVEEKKCSQTTCEGTAAAAACPDWSGSCSPSLNVARSSSEDLLLASFRFPQSRDNFARRKKDESTEPSTSPPPSPREEFSDFAQRAGTATWIQEDEDDSDGDRCSDEESALEQADATIPCLEATLVRDAHDDNVGPCFPLPSSTSPAVHSIGAFGAVQDARHPIPNNSMSVHSHYPPSEDLKMVTSKEGEYNQMFMALSKQVQTLELQLKQTQAKEREQELEMELKRLKAKKRENDLEKELKQLEVKRFEDLEKQVVLKDTEKPKQFRSPVSTTEAQGGAVAVGSSMAVATSGGNGCCPKECIICLMVLFLILGILGFVAMIVLPLGFFVWIILCVVFFILSCVMCCLLCCGNENNIVVMGQNSTAAAGSSQV